VTARVKVVQSRDYMIAVLSLLLTDGVMSGSVARVYYVTWPVHEYHLASTVALVRLLVQYYHYLHSLCSVIVTKYCTGNLRWQAPYASLNRLTVARTLITVGCDAL
jgi:hypothetical protein